MTIHCQRCGEAPPVRCTACTPPDDRDPMMQVEIRGVGGQAMIALCEYHREWFAMMLDQFAPDFMERALADADEEIPT